MLLYIKKSSKKLNRVYIDKINYDKLSGEYQRLEHDFKRLLSGLKRIRTFEELETFITDGAKITNTIKHGITGKNFSKKGYTEVGSQTFKSNTKGVLLSSILRVNREHYKFKHPTQKPVQLLEQLVLLLTDDNDLVLDPFMGSGSTGIACKNLNRNFIGIEKVPEYFELAQSNIE